MIENQSYFNGIVSKRSSRSWLRLNTPTDAENVSANYAYNRTLHNNIKRAKKQSNDFSFRYMVFDNVDKVTRKHHSFLFDTSKLVRITIGNDLKINGMSINDYFEQYIGKYLFLIVER